MSEITEKPSEEENGDLTDIDSLLDQEDPDFRKDLNEVAEIKAEGELDEDSAIEELADAFDEEAPEASDDAVNESKTSLLVFLKTRPKEFLGFFLGQTKGRFKNFSRSQKGMLFLLLILCVGVILLTVKNLKGVWIPSLNPPVVRSLHQVADEVFEIAPESRFEMFGKAFPKSPDLFLFDKFKVNLKPGPGHPNPMGAFEVVLELDSKGSAVEVQQRQVEFHDLIQRNFETQTYPSMLTEGGKQALKNLIKKDLDQKLSQGWVEDVHFQTFILKP